MKESENPREGQRTAACCSSVMNRLIQSEVLCVKSVIPIKKCWPLSFVVHETTAE